MLNKPIYELLKPIIYFVAIPFICNNKFFLNVNIVSFLLYMYLLQRILKFRCIIYFSNVLENSKQPIEELPEDIVGEYFYSYTSFNIKKLVIFFNDIKLDLSF